jgi:hypothetical protein
LSLDVSGPQRIISGANAIGAWCWQLRQLSHIHDVLRLSSANVGIGGNGLRIRQFEREISDAIEPNLSG